jgi:hypothetical protein
MPRFEVLLAALLACACTTLTAIAWATQTMTIHASFNPDKLGAPTNLSATATFHSTTAAPSPVSKVTAYLPAGLAIDVRGAGTCVATKLEAGGPGACPADSRIGFGGGVGLIDLFLGPRENGRLVVLAYVNAASPASLQIVVVAREVHAPKPYGLGFTFDIPPIPTLPGASNASIESAFLTVGDKNVAYYKQVHGKHKLLHVQGIVVPKTCPSGGFPIKATIDFADSTTLTATPTIPCPRQ